MYDNLKVVFKLETPVCLTYPFLFFDGILAHLANRRDNPDYRFLPSKKVVKEVAEIPIPVEKVERDGEWVYKASVAEFDFKEPSTAIIYKKFCERYLDYKQLKVKKIDRGRGFFKDFSIKLMYFPAKTATFYVRGIKEEIKALLEGLPGLGKKTAIGYGFIRCFKVQKVKNDYSIVKDGKAMRPIPIDLVASAERIVQLAYKPPYWAKENVKPCACPFFGVELDV